MDEAQAAIERHGNGHPRVGDRVHVGGNDGDVELEAFGQPRFKLRLAREHFGIKGRERDVVKGQADVVVGREEGVRRLVESGIKLV